jgi:type I restriction enzyme S subunit
MSSKKGYKSVKWLFGKEIEIPEEWEIKRFGDKIKLEYGSGLTAEQRDNSGNPVYGSGGIIGLHSKPIVKGVGIIVARKGSLGNVFYEQQDFFPIDTVFYITENETTFNLLFLFYYLTNMKLENFAIVTSKAGISRSEIHLLKIIIPPLPEQQKIATILSNVDSLIDSTRQVIENSKSLKKSLMQKLLTRGIGHTKFKKVKWFFGKEIEIPEEWELANFESFTKKITYGFTNPMPTTNEGAWMITATNIKNGKIVYETARKTSREAYDNLITVKSRPKKDLILITKDGTLGEVAIVDREDICINQSVASIDYDNSKISSDYLLLSLQSKLIKQFIDIFSPQTTIRHIYITDIPNWKIPLPPFSEQQKIASILSNIDAQIDSQTQYKDKLERLKKSLMQKLLTGQVRVKV